MTSQTPVLRTLAVIACLGLASFASVSSPLASRASAARERPAAVSLSGPPSDRPTLATPKASPQRGRPCTAWWCHIG